MAKKAKGVRQKANDKPQPPPAHAQDEEGAVVTAQPQDDEHMARALDAAAQAPVAAAAVDAPTQVQAHAAAGEVAENLPDDPWARPIDPQHTAESPHDEAFAANLEGRQVVSPLQGFGRLWQRTYRVRLAGVQVTPEAVMAEWKANFPRFQPDDNRFYPTSAGVEPGQMVYIDSNLMQGPGVSQMTEIASGVMVIYSDATSFTVMTPEGFPVAGWNTFSAYEEEGVVVAQVQGLERAADPIYEFGYRFLGGERKQDRTWIHVLRALAAHFGVTADVQSSKTLVDARLQWRRAGNVWHNAAIRTLLFRLATPLRQVRNGARAS